MVLSPTNNLKRRSIAIIKAKSSMKHLVYGRSFSIQKSRALPLPRVPLETGLICLASCTSRLGARRSDCRHYSIYIRCYENLKWLREQRDLGNALRVDRSIRPSCALRGLEKTRPQSRLAAVNYPTPHHHPRKRGSRANSRRLTTLSPALDFVARRARSILKRYMFTTTSRAAFGPVRLIQIGRPEVWGGVRDAMP